jgi:predicted oxidoreductase
MEISSLSVAMNQAQVREEMAVGVQAMALQNVRDTMSENLQRTTDAAAMITDPARGNFLDITA